MLNLPQRKGEGQEANISAELSVNKHRKGSEDLEQVGNKPLPKAGKVVDHRTHLLRQKASSQTELPCSTEKQIVNCNKTQRAEGVGGTQHAPERGGRSKK
jgi:hypothetical protein